jgi:hypothetical protein
MAAAFAHALSAGWRRWGDLVVDTGREVDLPRRLAEGQLLYRDARFYYGPLAPYANALLYRIFGVHLDVLVWAGIASAALLCVALYRLATFFFPRFGATAVVVSFLYLCAFAHLYVGAIFNFVLPYTFAATYGMVAATWSLVFLVDHVRTGRTAVFLLSAACLSLAALSKLEAFAPAAAAHAVFLAGALAGAIPLRRLYAAGYGAATAVVLAVYGGFAAVVGPGLWGDNLAGVVNRGSRKFMLAVMGLGNPTASLAAMGLSALLLGATLGLSWFAARALARREAPAPAGWLVVVATGVATFLAYRWWELHVHFRALPLVMVLVLAVLAVLFARQPDRRQEWLAHVLLWVFGLACLWRIVLNSRPHHYGFYLIPVGLVCLGVVFFEYGPRVASPGAWSGRVFGAAGIGLLAASATMAYADSRQFDALQAREISTPRGRLRILDRWGLQIAAVRALSLLPPGTRVATVPEGSGLLYFSGAREADTMFSYLPMEVVGVEGDTELLTRWKGNPPDVAVWVGVPLDEFGSSGFGADYAQRSMAWLLAEYAPVTDPMAAIVLLARRKKLLRDPALRGIALSAADSDRGETVTGTVLEFFDRGDGTFLRLDTGRGKVWVGVSESKVAAGATVTVFDAAPGAMEDRGLRRRFERLLVGRLDPPETTVARVLAAREALKDRDVAIRGTVTEVLPSSGRLRRVRVRDARGTPGRGEDEVVVITRDTLQVGEAVLVRGTVRVGADFGAGLADAVVLESWRISR